MATILTPVAVTGGNFLQMCHYTATYTPETIPFTS